VAHGFVAMLTKLGLFDHFVSASEKGGGDFKSKCFGRFQIDVNLVPIRLLNGKICRFGSTDDLINVDCTLPGYRKKIRPQAYQTSCRNRFAEPVTRWQGMRKREFSDRF